MPASSYFNAVAALTETEQIELKGLARQVIVNGLEQHQLILPAQPKSKALQQVAANFVTLYRDHELCGCIGCYTSEKPLWQDICQHAYSSAFKDFRFSPLQKAELATLSIEVSILSELEALENNGEQALIEALVPNVDGLLMKESTLYGGKQSALFLPSVWKSLSSAESFVLALKQKAGWPSDYWSENIELFRFNTQVF